jgi:DNA-binding transcriptional LysR family regulator
MPNIKKIDLNLLVVLEALLDERNVTRAAARLGYTQPTISGMLTRLRDLFGDPLFVRTQRGLLATPRAQALAVPLKQLLADSQRLFARDVFDPASAEVTYNISSNDYMQHALLVPFVEILRSEARHVRLAIMPPIVKGLGEALAHGQIDLAVTIPEFAMSDLPSRLLYREHYVVAVRAQHPLARRATVTVERFCNYDHVVVSPTGVLRRPNRSGACSIAATAQGSLLRAELPVTARDIADGRSCRTGSVSLATRKRRAAGRA